MDGAVAQVDVRVMFRRLRERPDGVDEVESGGEVAGLDPQVKSLEGEPPAGCRTGSDLTCELGHLPILTHIGGEVAGRRGLGIREERLDLPVCRAPPSPPRPCVRS